MMANKKALFVTLVKHVPRFVATEASFFCFFFRQIRLICCAYQSFRCLDLDMPIFVFTTTRHNRLPLAHARGVIILQLKLVLLYCTHWKYTDCMQLHNLVYCALQVSYPVERVNRQWLSSA